MRFLLSATNYAKYRQYESAKLALHEYEIMQSYAEENDFTLEAAYKPRLVEMIQQVKAYTIEMSGGPYDGMPRPIAGAEPVIQHAEGQIADLTEKLPRIDRKAAELGLPDAYKAFLQGYYGHKIQSLRGVCEFFQDPSIQQSKREEIERILENLHDSKSR